MTTTPLETNNVINLPNIDPICQNANKVQKMKKEDGKKATNKLNTNKGQTEKKLIILPASEGSCIANIVVGEHATPGSPRAYTLLLDLQCI